MTSRCLAAQLQLEQLTELVERLRNELRSSGPRRPGSLLEASERLAMPARTLQRHLQQQGTTFSAELDRARRELALQRVIGTRAPLADIAKELGLADATVFSRSFRRWYGDTPGALRRLHQKK